MLAIPHPVHRACLRQASFCLTVCSKSSRGAFPDLPGSPSQPGGTKSWGTKFCPLADVVGERVIHQGGISNSKSGVGRPQKEVVHLRDLELWPWQSPHFFWLALRLPSGHYVLHACVQLQKKWQPPRQPSAPIPFHLCLRPACRCQEAADPAHLPDRFSRQQTSCTTLTHHRSKMN